MAFINKHDINGTKGLLAKGELGYDDYSAGGDTGRVYVGTGSVNIPQAKKAEVIAVDGKVDTHTARADNPHSVTKTQVGLGNVQNVDTTNASNITSGTLANVRLANSGVTAGTYKSVTVDGKGIVTGGTNPTTLSGYSITDAYTKTETNTQISTAVAALVDSSPGTLDTLNELAAALGDDPNFATTTANAIAAKVPKVTSTDNAIVRFDGTTGVVQNSAITIDDNGNIGSGTQTFNGFGGGGFKNLVINGLKQVNQTGLTSTDNSYNYDNHYKSGNNWYIPIDGRSIISGTKYVLSWAGAATASYHISNATSLTINSQTFTPIAKGESITPIISAGQNLWIKFSSDSAGSTYNFVQFERGSTPSPFELRPYPFELFLCMSLYELLGTCSFHGYGLTGNAFSNQYRFKVTKRINPSVYTGSILTQINCTIGTINANTIFATMPITVTNNGAFVADVTNVVADARF